MTRPRPRQNPARAAHRRAVLAVRKPPTLPVPMGVDPERPYACDQCGDLVMLCAADPLPAGWVAVGVGRGTRYLCRLHAGEASP